MAPFQQTPELSLFKNFSTPAPAPENDPGFAGVMEFGSFARGSDTSPMYPFSTTIAQ